MINPEFKSQWRPIAELTGRFSLDPSLSVAEVYQPTDHADALAYVSELSLQSVVDYDGYPDVQTTIVEEVAERMFPSLFYPAAQATAEHIEPVPDEPLSLLKQHRRPNGQVNWDALAKVTRYAVNIQNVPDLHEA